MSKTTTNYAQTSGILVATAVGVHYLGSLDWPWAIVIGALGGEVLGSVADDVAFLAGAMSSPDPETRLTAVEAVGEVGVTIASTFSNAFRKSFRINVRTF